VVFPADHPEWRERGPRLNVMDEQGVQAAVMLPSAGVFLEYDFQSRPDALAANYQAFNHWLEEDWGYGGDGRIFAVPILTLTDLDKAVQECERVAGLGARVVWISHRPVQGRSPADPVFDPFWSRVQDLGLKVAFHTGFEGFTYLYGSHWSEDPHRHVGQWSAFQHYVGYGARAISDALAALVLQNLFGRFPGVEIISIENGSSWLPWMMEQMDHAALIGANGQNLGGPLDDTPSEILKRHLYINPFHEEDVTALVELVGADRVLFGSDWPHPEGLAQPLAELETLATKVTAEDFYKIMRGNAAALLGLS